MNFSLLTVSILAASLLIGLTPVLVDGVCKSIETRLSLSEGRAKLHGYLFFFSWLPGMPLAGFLIDSWSGYEQEMLFFTLVALILSVAWLALVRSFLSLALNALFLGFAYSCLATGLIRMMPTAFFTQQTNAAAGMNIGFIAVGLGALVGPALISAIERRWGFRQGLLRVSVAIILPAAMIALCSREGFAAPVSTLSWREFLAHPHLALVVGIILVYFAIENCLGFWPERYLLELGYRERKLHMAIVVFWLMFVATRGAAAWWLYHYPDHAIALALVLVVMTVLLLGNLVGGFEGGSGTFTFWLLGGCYGPILPCFLGIALEVYGKPIPASGLGALLALSGLDTLVVRPLMGLYAKERPARVVMRVPTVLALLLGAPLVLMMFLRY